MVNGLINKELIECQQQGNCGLSSVCSYSFIYTQPCVAGDDDEKNCTGTKGNNEELIEGNIMLLKNGLDHVVDYTWNVVGYARDSKTDDVSARKYMLPSFSYAYFDTNVPLQHTVRLINNGETIDTKTSSKRECTIKEACQYLLRACQSSFAFVTTNSMELKINCMLRSKACDYFVHLPDLSSLSETKELSNDNGETTTTNSDDDDDDTIDGYRNGASVCMVDCMWRWFPSNLLPTKTVLNGLIDSLDVLRRVHFGISLNPKENIDLTFTNDKEDVFHTTRDDELISMLNRGDIGDGIHGSQNTAVITWLVLFSIFMTVLFTVFASYIYYIRYYKKKKSLCGGGGGKRNDDVLHNHNQDDDDFI